MIELQVVTATSGIFRECTQRDSLWEFRQAEPRKFELEIIGS